MRTEMGEPDWALWRSFAAVLEDGSLSAAARRLGLSQPTIGRHIETLEVSLKAELFERTANGLKATELGHRVYGPIAEAQRSMAEAAMMAAGASDELQGAVRITSSEVMCHYVLPELLLEIREHYPQVAIELVASDTSENLLLREADIAVRLFRPTQLELITKRIGQLPMCACAHESYLQRRGEPQNVDELRQHDLIGFDRGGLILLAARAMGFELSRNDFALRTDSQTAMWEMMRAGLGIGFSQALLVQKTPGMRQILPQLTPPGLDIWLTTHRELYQSRRIRVIYERLAAGLARYLRADAQ